jgi:predicted amidophosphoribosyltransferase
MMMPGVRAGDLVAALADLVLGGRCAGCGRPGLGACDQCVAAVRSPPPFPVPWLAPDLPPVLAGGPYADELRRLLLAAKERGALGLLPLLGERVAAGVAAWVLAAECGDPVVLVPVPSARRGVVERGVDLPSELARRAAHRLRVAGLPVQAWRGLRLVRRPLDQSELGRDDRLANLGGAMAASGRIPQGSVVVVDDIVTTGATLVEAARALSATGRAPAAAITVAATVRRHGVR